MILLLYMYWMSNFDELSGICSILVFSFKWLIWKLMAVRCKISLHCSISWHMFMYNVGVKFWVRRFTGEYTVKRSKLTWERLEKSGDRSTFLHQDLSRTTKMQLTMVYSQGSKVPASHSLPKNHGVAHRGFTTTKTNGTPFPSRWIESRA